MHHRHLAVAIVIGLALALPVRAQEDALPVPAPQEEQGGGGETLSAVVRGAERMEDGGQELTVELLAGAKDGERAALPYYGQELSAGDRVFIRRTVTFDGEELLQVDDLDRRMVLLAVSALFVLAVIALGRWQGVRALVSLALSVAAIAFILIPRILAGASPVAWGIAVAIGILFTSIALTHGVNRASLAAFLGTAVSIVLTGALAAAAVAAARFSGIADDATFYLDIESGGTIDLRGLLLAAIIIGVIGVLDDVAVTQAAAVEELHGASPGITARELFQRALRIGREHVGALVNTLALAYAGAALPLLLLFRGAASPLDEIINREMIAVEVVRTLVGSIGVIAAVPLATAFAVFLIHRQRGASAGA